MRNGYPIMSIVVNGKKTSRNVHKWIWEQINGPVPAGHQIDHRCMNTVCIRYEHLECVTASENKRRAWIHKVRPDDCPRCGNSDWYVRPDRGHRECRICRNPASRRVNKMVRGATQGSAVVQRQEDCFLDPHECDVLHRTPAASRKHKVIPVKELNRYVAHVRRHH